MEISKAIENLIIYNAWRRGAEIKQPDPYIIGLSIDKAIEVMESEQAPTDVLTTEIMFLRERNEELSAWKESATQVMNDLNLQAIGDELGFKLGSSIAPQVLPAIKKMKDINAEMLCMLESRLKVFENCGMKNPKALIELITKAKEV